MRVLLPLLAIWFAGCATASPYHYTLNLLPDQAPQEQPAWGIEPTVEFSTHAIIVSLANRGDRPVRVPWDEWAYIDPDQVSHRLVTSSVRRITMNLPQPAPSLPPGSSIRETLIPADYAESTILRSLFPLERGPLETLYSGYRAPGSTLQGKEIRVHMVVERDGRQRTLTLRYTVGVE